MKVLDFIIGVFGMMICTVTFTIASLITYIPSALMAIYIGMRRKGKHTIKAELNDLNKLYMSNIQNYFHSYI